MFFVRAEFMQIFDVVTKPITGSRIGPYYFSMSFLNVLHTMIILSECVYFDVEGCREEKVVWEMDLRGK